MISNRKYNQFNSRNKKKSFAALSFHCLIDSLFLIERFYNVKKTKKTKKKPKKPTNPG